MFCYSLKTFNFPVFDFQISVLTTAFIEVKVSSNAQDLTVEQQRRITKELERLVHKNISIEDTKIFRHCHLIVV